MENKFVCDHPTCNRRHCIADVILEDSKKPQVCVVDGRKTKWKKIKGIIKCSPKNS